MNIDAVYRTHIVTCDPATVLRDVAERMERADAGMVAVVADGQLSGVITERDLIRALARESSPQTVPADAYATSEVLTASLDDDVADVGRRMVEEGVRRLPVLDQEGRLCGMVSMRDLFAVEMLLPPEGGEGA